jgi:small ligand-binding sensory domain FIST
MPFAAGLSTAEDSTQALAEVCEIVQTGWTGPMDLAVAFFSPHHSSSADGLARTLAERLAPRGLIGCIAESVIGGEREIEQGAALSVWIGRWKTPVAVEPFQLELERTSEGSGLLGWPDGLVEAVAARSAILLLGDPYSFPVDSFLGQINDDSPGVRVMGGMASGVRGPGQIRLLLGDSVKREGAVGVLLQGELGMRPIVSQGCRPIGRPMIVTKAKDNVILELGGKPPLTVLQDLWQSLPPEEQGLFQQGLHVGRVICEYGGEFKRGDFLVRNILGLDRTNGALAINERVRVGQTVQFHVRDAGTADEDLHALLRSEQEVHARRPAGGLVFSCNGRGSRLFNALDHDAKAVLAEAGPIPLAGFFAQGELGPIGGRNFIHGFTASVALFEE